MNIIAVANQKGGVGKTTTAVNLCACLPGRKALIDLDPQGSATICSGLDPDNIDKTIYTLMRKESSPEYTILHLEHFDLIPANDDLSEFDLFIIKNQDTFNPPFVLRNALKPILNSYDYIIIDCPPSKGLLTINALSASTDVIIPMQCEYLATKGVSKIIDTIQNVQKSYNLALNLRGIVGTMFDMRTNISTVVLQEARKFFVSRNVIVFDTVIKRLVRYAEAPMLGKIITESYMQLAEEIINGKEN